MFKNTLVVGVLLVILGMLFLYIFRGKMNFYYSLFLGVVWVGAIFIMEYFSIIICNYSLRGNLGVSKKIAISVFLFIIFQEIFGGIFPRLWSFSIWTPLQYVILAPLAYTVYGFGLVQSYIISKGFLEKLFGFIQLPDYEDGELSSEIILLVLGVSAIWLAIIYTAYYTSVNWEGFLNFNSYYQDPFAWWYPFLPYVGLALVCEYVCYLQGKLSLIHTIIRKNYIPLFAIAFAAVLGILFFEVTNTPFLFWKYSNWPLFDYRIFEIPLLAIIWWPIQFVALLSLLRCVLKVEELDIW